MLKIQIKGMGTLEKYRNNIIKYLIKEKLDPKITYRSKMAGMT